MIERRFSDGIESEDRCTDAKCWKRKVSDHWKTLRKEHKASGGTILAANATFGKGSKVFPKYYDGRARLNHQAPYVQLSDEIDRYGSSRKTWGQLLEGELEPADIIIAKIGEEIFRLAPKAKAERIRKAKAPKQKTAAESDWEKQAKERAKKERARRKIERAVFAEVADQVGIIAKASPTLQLQDVAGVAVDYLRGWEGIETKDMSVSEALLALMVAKLVGRHNKTLEDADRKLAELLGVDVAGIEAEVAEAANAKRKKATKKRSRKAKA